MKQNVSRLLAFGTIGAAAGFAYYYFIGCQTGTCAISSDPVISTAYGTLMGVVLGWGGKRDQDKEQERE